MTLLEDGLRGETIYFVSDRKESRHVGTIDEQRKVPMDKDVIAPLPIPPTVSYTVVNVSHTA
jgi:hypothetical protein